MPSTRPKPCSRVVPIPQSLQPWREFTLRTLKSASVFCVFPHPAREKQKPGSCCQRGDLNGVAEVLQTHDEASGVDGFGPLVEVVRAEIAIEFTADQHVVDAGQDRGGERAERLFGAAAGAQAVDWAWR